MKGKKFFLVSLVALFFAITGRATVKTEGFFDTLTAYTEFNHNKVLKFSIEAEFKSMVLMKVGITMPASSVPNNVLSVEIVFSDGYTITDEDNPVQPVGGNDKEILVNIDEDWAGLLSYMFGGTGYQYSESKLRENMDKLSRSDIKTIVFTTKEDREIKVPITYPTTNVFKEIFHSLISVSQSSKYYGEKAKKFFAPYLAKFPLNASSNAGASSSGKSKNGSGGKNSNKSAGNKSVSKPATDEQLRKYILHPLGSLNSDTYFSYLNTCENLKRTYGKDCRYEYDGCGKIYLYNLEGLNVGGFQVNNASLWIYNDKSEWSYKFPDKHTLSEAKDVCNAIASKIKALGVELTDKPSDSFPVYYRGKMGEKDLRLSACKMSDKYYLTLEITDFKTAKQPDINPEVSVAELFDRPLGAPQGVDPIRWFLENGYAGKVNEKQNDVRCYSGSSNNNLSLHIPIQGSKIYQGLKSTYFSLNKADRNSYNKDKDIYIVEFIGELKPTVKSWNVKSKQEKEELKYIWNNLIHERLRLGHKPVKANKKAPEFKQWNPTECYIESDGAITRRYILTKNNKVIVSEEKTSRF